VTAELRFDSKVVVVTGGGRGIGREYCLAFAARGAKVVVNDLGGALGGGGASDGPAREVVQEITANGGQAIADGNDISTPDGARRLVDEAVRTFRQVDVVVNNAGIYHEGTPFADTTLEHFETFWRVHLGGTINVTHAAWPHFLDQSGGRVINTGSCGGLYGQPGALAYSAAKGAVHGFTSALAQESLQHNIHVNQIAPAAMTRMASDEFADDAQREMLAKAMHPSYIAPAVLWLAHDSCQANGQIFEAGAGRVGRVRIGEPSGAWDVAPTPESVAADLYQAEAVDDLYFPVSATDYGGWLVQGHLTNF
jgi:NAD(P)-dependent dehydrogenase (short-subunit alcohol dehydrogenase family)